MQPDGLTDSAISRELFADEILRGAAESLRRVGFSDEAVRDAFFRASGRVAQEPGNRMGAEYESNIQHDGDVASPSTITRIIEQFNDLPETKSFRLAGERLESLLASSDPAKEVKGIEMVRSALPLREASILWLRATAEVNGVPVGFCRSDWILNGEHEDIILADHVLFLDQFGIGNSNFIFNAIQLLELLLSSGKSSNIIDLSELLFREELAIVGEDRKRISSILDKVDIHGRFCHYVMDVTEIGEIDQESIIANFQLVQARGDFSYLLKGWLDAMEAQDVIARQKRSNRVIARRAPRLGGRPY